MPSGIRATLAGLLIVAGTSCPSLAADSRFAGFLVDRSCADNCKAQGTEVNYLQTHKKECALNDGCSREGYAVFSKGQWYQLDSKGNDLARHLLKSSPTKEGHFVQVLGTVDKGQLKVSAIKELAAQE